MHDRPSIDELLRGVEVLLDEFAGSLDGARRYNARVARNVVRTVRRELEHDERQMDEEWRGLDAVLAARERPAGAAATKQALRERNEELSERIRAGNADGGEFRDVVLAHVRATVRAKLEVSDPGWLEG